MAILNDNGVNVAPRRNYFKERQAAVPAGAMPTARQLEAASGVLKPNGSEAANSNLGIYAPRMAAVPKRNVVQGTGNTTPVAKPQGTVMPAVNPNSATDGVNALAKMMMDEVYALAK